MTQEEKELLLKDLCARLLYQPKLQIYYEEMSGSGVFDEKLYEVDVDGQYFNDGIRIENIKPYLRSMSSMTEEEWEHLGQISLRTNIYDDKKFNAQSVKGLDIDYLNSIYVDYRGLIPMGLALEAPEDMYKNK